MKRNKIEVFLVLLAFVLLSSSCNSYKKRSVINQRFETDLRDFMLEFTEETSVPGMGFAFCSDRVGTVMLTVGQADVENNIPLDKNAQYPVQSTTKMFLSIVTLQLREEGMLTLETTIDAWADSVPNSNRITIRDLLQHTSGLNRYQADREFMERYYSDTIKKYSRDDFIRAGLALPYNTEDYGRFNYSNINYLILANIIETITRNSIGQVLRQRIFIPAEMTRTYYKPEVSNDTTELVKCYRNGQVLDLDKINFASNAAGGIVSTLDDMMKFAHWVLDNQYYITMSSGLVDNFTVDNQVFKYGLGLEVIENMYNTTLYGHAGGNPGFIHELYFSPANREIIILFFNEGEPGGDFKFRARLSALLEIYR